MWAVDRSKTPLVVPVVVIFRFRYAVVPAGLLRQEVVLVPTTSAVEEARTAL